MGRRLLRRRSGSAESAEAADSPSPPPARRLQKRRPVPASPARNARNDREDSAGPADRATPDLAVEDDSEDLLRMFIPERPKHTVSDDPNEARLVITHIVVDNFKSYFGRKVLGPFHKVSDS